MKANSPQTLFSDSLVENHEQLPNYPITHKKAQVSRVKSSSRLIQVIFSVFFTPFLIFCAIFLFLKLKLQKFFNETKWNRWEKFFGGERRTHFLVKEIYFDRKREKNLRIKCYLDITK